MAQFWKHVDPLEPSQSQAPSLFLTELHESIIGTHILDLYSRRHGRMRTSHLLRIVINHDVGRDRQYVKSIFPPRMS